MIDLTIHVLKAFILMLLCNGCKLLCPSICKHHLSVLSSSVEPEAHRCLSRETGIAPRLSAAGVGEEPVAHRGR